MDAPEIKITLKMDLTKDAGFVYESLRIETNQVIWDFCLHETNPQNESFKNESTKRIFRVRIHESGFANPNLKDL